MIAVTALREQAVDLAWSLWGELGVSTWQRAHENWSIELEPLIAYTAFIAGDDSRLLRESVDWCVSNSPFISLRQLRHVVTQQRWPFKGEMARFGATVGAHTGRAWPGAGAEPPYELKLSGKSRLADLRRPALLQLRLRSLFGVSARAEIVRVLLVDPSPAWTVNEIAERVAYTRRQVAIDLDMLDLGGLLERRVDPGPAAFRMRDAERTAELLGPVPSVAPRWAPILRCAIGLIEALEESSRRPLQAPAAELARHVRLLEPELRAARLRPPSPRGPDDIEEAAGWIHELVSALAEGSPNPLFLRDALGAR